MHLHQYTLQSLRTAIQSGETNAPAIFAHFRARALAHNGQLSAMVTIADAPAHFADDSTPLAGIPIGIKDVFAQS